MTLCPSFAYWFSAWASAEENRACWPALSLRMTTFAPLASSLARVTVSFVRHRPE